jgi:hypothetical protein
MKSIKKPIDKSGEDRPDIRNWKRDPAPPDKS